MSAKHLAIFGATAATCAATVGYSFYKKEEYRQEQTKNEKMNVDDSASAENDMNEEAGTEKAEYIQEIPEAGSDGNKPDSGEDGVDEEEPTQETPEAGSNKGNKPEVGKNDVDDEGPNEETPGAGSDKGNKPEGGEDGVDKEEPIQKIPEAGSDKGGKSEGGEAGVDKEESIQKIPEAGNDKGNNPDNKEGHHIGHARRAGSHTQGPAGPYAHGQQWPSKDQIDER